MIEVLLMSGAGAALAVLLVLDVLPRVAVWVWNLGQEREKRY